MLRALFNAILPVAGSMRINGYRALMRINHSE